jgi:phosphoenolpyruvate carboxykinase (GTP)
MATAPHLISPLSSLSSDVAKWVEQVRQLTQPKAIHWCDGSDAEIRELTQQLEKSGEL